MTFRLHPCQYHVVIYEADANGGPGACKLELDADALNLVWQKSLNAAGQAAFTLLRYNPKLALLDFMQDHVKVYREHSGGIDCVFAGKLIKPQEGSRDSILYCWDYEAFLQRSRTGFKTMYPNKKIGTEIVGPEWDLAKTTADSVLAFVATGTIEDPVGVDGTTPITVNSIFGLLDFDRLFTFYSLAEMAMSNTDNTVVFEITKDAPHTFNFWKNRTLARTDWSLVYPGNVVEYDFNPGYDELQNDMATIISDPNGQQVEYVVTDPISIAKYRRLQSAIAIKSLYGLNSGTTETDQQKAALARLLVTGVAFPRLITFFPRQGEIQPFHGWNLGDTFACTLEGADGGDEYNGTPRVISMAASWSPASGELLQLFAR